MYFQFSHERCSEERVSSNLYFALPSERLIKRYCISKEHEDCKDRSTRIVWA